MVTTPAPDPASLKQPPPGFPVSLQMQFRVVIT